MQSDHMPWFGWGSPRFHRLSWYTNVQAAWWKLNHNSQNHRDVGHSPMGRKCVMVHQEGRLCCCCMGAKQEDWSSAQPSSVPTVGCCSEEAGPGMYRWGGNYFSNAYPPTCLAHHVTLCPCLTCPKPLPICLCLQQHCWLGRRWGGGLCPRFP